MARQAQQALLAYLAELQLSRTCSGFEHRARSSKVMARSTAYRLQRRLGDKLRVAPSFALERLGLLHVHLFIRDARECWLRFPYAVEHAWLTPDFVGRVLYLHCVIPAAHVGDVEQLVEDCRQAGWCARVSVIAAGGAWQQFFLTQQRIDDVPSLVFEDDASRLLREQPLIVPVLFEAWGLQESYAGLWRRIASRMGAGLRSYVRGRLYRVNGKAHIARTYERLDRAGLFRQYHVHLGRLVEENVELVITVRRAADWLAEFLEEVYEVARVVEQFGGDDGTALVRVLGGLDLVRRIIELRDASMEHRASVYLRLKDQEGEAVRFCYEVLFDPRTGRWQYPREEILALMRGDR